MNNRERQIQQQNLEYQSQVRQEAKNQRIKKDAKGINQTKRQKVQEQANNFGTLTGALLNGSIVKWLFLMFMLVSTISIFNANSENHWLDETIVNGSQVLTFNDDAYEIDYMTYSDIGDQMIVNFQGITNILDNANFAFIQIGTLISAVYDFFTGELITDIFYGFSNFIAQLRYLPFRLIDLIFN